MTKSIWKWALDVQDGFSIRMPFGAALLTVAIQADVPCIWALVDPSHPFVERHIRIYGTGHPIELEEPYVGSFQLLGGSLVFHVFDGGEVIQ